VSAGRTAKAVGGPAATGYRECLMKQQFNLNQQINYEHTNT